MKKTKIAIYYHNHLRNDGPPLYYYLSLKKIFGVKNVIHLIPEGDTSRFGKFDYHFWVDYGEDSYIPDAGKWNIPDDGGKKIYVVSDAHLDKTTYRYNHARKFDYVFFNQQHYLKEYSQDLIPLVKKDGTFTVKMYRNPHLQQAVGYLPHAADPKAYPHTPRIPKYDVVFIGHVQEYEVGNGIGMNRMDFLDEIFKVYPNFYFGARNSAYPGKNMFEDAAQKFCASKIVLNISIGNDVNMRFFETLITGSFLLTNKIPELKSIEKYGFIDGVHYTSYTSLDDAKKKIKYYLEHDKERETIAKAAYKQALKTGTYKSRIQEIMSHVSL